MPQNNNSFKCLREDLIQIRNVMVNFYVLRDSDGLYLIDCGFIGGKKLLLTSLQECGWDKEPILGIILTHGHLDHILNVSSISQDYGAWIIAPELDSPFYEGKASYSGIAKITGTLEAVGKRLLNFTPFTPTRLINDGEKLDLWHGLEAIHLPGHTSGHMGYYCNKLQLLFSGDLFASYQHVSHLPPPFFNEKNNLITDSISKTREYQLVGLLPNHGDSASPDTHLSRLKRLHTKIA